jgi:hypothetical protein
MNQIKPVAWHICKDPDGEQESHMTCDGEFASSYERMGWRVTPLAPPIPDTHRIVPVEPTDKMLDAARDWSYKKYGKPIGNDAATGCWEAMLSATAQERT